MTTTKTKLTGGHAGYRAAVHEAQHGTQRSNPCVRYSEREGFTAQSTCYAGNNDEFTTGIAAFDANTGNPYLTGSASEYRRVRHILLVWFDAKRRELTRSQIANAVQEAEYSYDYEQTGRGPRR